MAEGDVTVSVNGQFLREGSQRSSVVTLKIMMHGDVTVSINGQDSHNAPPDQVRFEGSCSWVRWSR